MSSSAPPPLAHDRTVAAPGDLDLPRPPGAVRRFWAARPRLADAVVAAAYLLWGVFGTFIVFLATGTPPSPGTVTAQLIGYLVGAAAILLRRRRPLLALGVLTGVAVVGVLVGEGLDPLGVAIAAYAVAVHRSTRSAWLGWAAALLVTTAVPLLAAPVIGADAAPGGTPNPIFALVTLVGVLAGAAVGSRRRYVAALVQRAEDLARERDQRAELATLAERGRIAREMHDVLSHSLSIMVTLSDGAATTIPRDPDRAREAVEEAADLGRRSLGELRRLLGALDDPEGEGLRPQAGLADLPALVARCREAGLPVTLTDTGEPPISPGVGSAVHRIVQESLTNALRYATGATTVRVELTHTVEETIITVTDDGTGTADGRSPEGSGRGIAGMRERARLHGGRLEAGPRPGGGWTVTATVPWTQDRR